MARRSLSWEGCCLCQISPFATGLSDTARHHNHKKHKVPDGFVLRVDPKTGYRYIVPEGETKGMDEKTYLENRRRLMMEHNKWPSMCSPKKDLTRFGNGVYLYFDFIRFTTITNVFLALILAVNIGFHFYYDGWHNFSLDDTQKLFNGSTTINNFNTTGFIAGARNNLENLFVSSYSSRNKLIWLITTLVAVAATFLFGPSLAFHVKRHFKALGLHDTEDMWTTDDLDIIRSKDGKPKNHKFPQVHRIFLAYLVFVLMLLVSTLVTMALNLAYVASMTSSEPIPAPCAPFSPSSDPCTRYSLTPSSASASPSPAPPSAPSPTAITSSTIEETYKGNKNYIFAVAISIFLALSNYVWWKLCELLTVFEAHYTWTLFRKHLVVKYYIFKMLNLTLVFLTRWAVHNYYTSLRARLPVFEWLSLPQHIARQKCSIVEDAEQFLILMILDLTVHRAVAVVWPWFSYKCWARTCGKGKAGDKSDKGRPDFDIAVEYLELLYRQFILYLGFPIFPPLVIITLIGNFFEYPIDKWVLLRLAKTPPHLGGSMRSFLVFFMFFTALISVAIFPIGIGWTLSGFTYRDCAGTFFYTGA